MKILFKKAAENLVNSKKRDNFAPANGKEMTQRVASKESAKKVARNPIPIPLALIPIYCLVV